MILPGIIPAIISKLPLPGQDAAVNINIVPRVDNFGSPEITGQVMTPPDPVQSFLIYQCEILPELDPGTILHKPLPQTAQPVDTLGVYNVTDGKAGEQFSSPVNINLKSNWTQADIVQQAATPTYMFCLKGHGLRVAYPVPIPNLENNALGGTLIIPANPHKIKANRIVANFNGLPVWYAEWELWYYCPVPPQMSKNVGTTAAPNLAEKLDGTAPLPEKIQEPVSQPEQVMTNANWPEFAGKIPGAIDLRGIPR